jgi:hypothetical protein
MPREFIHPPKYKPPPHERVWDCALGRQTDTFNFLGVNIKSHKFLEEVDSSFDSTQRRYYYRQRLQRLYKVLRFWYLVTPAHHKAWFRKIE